MVNPKAVEILEQNPAVKEVVSLEIQYERSGDKALQRLLLEKKRKLSTAQLMAVDRITQRRIEAFLKTQTDKSKGSE